MMWISLEQAKAQEEYFLYLEDIYWKYFRFPNPQLTEEEIATITKLRHKYYLTLKDDYQPNTDRTGSSEHI